MDAPDSLATAAAGMRLQAERLAVITQNLANVSTPGYHAERAAGAQFGDELHTSISRSDDEGALRRTDVETDFALVGPGYFAVAAPEGVRYTRDGHLTRDAAGFLCDAHGNRLLGSLGPVRFPAGATVDPNGRVASSGRALDRLRIVTLGDVTTDPSGYAVPEAGQPIVRGSARVQQRYLEDAGVDAIAEMSALIATQRAFEANQKTVQRLDETLKRAATEVGRGRP
ncbi:MAG: flagellar hook basal-body protein [Candidatus Eremiobacteraeota bacterium]|nr:flagellar hook basal-body protein [Candidatus Eremiobacteraeota bacterium]